MSDRLQDDSPEELLTDYESQNVISEKSTAEELDEAEEYEEQDERKEEDKEEEEDDDQVIFLGENEEGIDFVPEIKATMDEEMSGPYLSQNCDLPANILEFDHSFGYDSQRLFNLCVIDSDVLIFASGNLIHFLNIKTGEKWYRRCCSGAGIGHITINPVDAHVAVAERGTNPNIFIYEWPSFEVVSTLRRGTKTAYSHVNYSVDGTLLCSQGSFPDFLLTIWNWRSGSILLRARAFGQQVFSSRLSVFIPSHLTTSGSGHIRFWKMAQTFTGLKLQGEIGRFGKSEICDIVGYLALPDEKVVSGCEWGNILVWDEGVIRVEVFRRGRVPCHEAPITQFMFSNGELTTVAMDGTIKVWNYETIEQADPPEEDRVIEVEPIFEFEVGSYHKAQLMSVVKRSQDSEEDVWFAQDGNGGIWKLELSTALNADKPKQVYRCHSGPVVSVQASPFSPHFMSLGRDGRVFLYDFQKKAVTMEKKFMAGGCCLLWLPLEIEESGNILLGGFDDGMLRMFAVSIQEHSQGEPAPTANYIELIQVSKPHTKAVTAVSVNIAGNLLVTGSEDATIFLYLLEPGPQFPVLRPVGYTTVTGPVSCLAWKPDEEAAVLVGCENGTLMEIELPTVPPSDNNVSYLLQNLPTKTLKCVSVKSRIRRETIRRKIEEENKAAMLEKRRELEKIYEENPGVFVDEDDFFATEGDEQELPPVFVPEVPSAILFAVYTAANTIWLSMEGYDAGFMYEYEFGKEGPISCTPIPDAEDNEVYSYSYGHNGKYLVLGMQGGIVRVIGVNKGDHRDLSNYWELSMHDNINGVIHQIEFDPSSRHMFTCGSDANVFSYLFNQDDGDSGIVFKMATSKGFPLNTVEDMDGRNHASLEQEKKNIENERKLNLANDYKRDVSETLQKLQTVYESIVKANNDLPKSQQLNTDELVLDRRVVDDLNCFLKDEMDLVKRKLAWEVEKSRFLFYKLRGYFIGDLESIEFKVQSIEKPNLMVTSFRQRKLGAEYVKYEELVMKTMDASNARGSANERLYPEELMTEAITRRPNPVTAIMKQIMALCGDYRRNIKLRRLLRKYSEQKDTIENRRIEWLEMMKKQPDPNMLDPEDVTAIASSRETIGDYKLKTAPDYKVPKHLKVNMVSMYGVLLRTRRLIFEEKDNYNKRVLELRDRKLNMIKRHEYLKEQLTEIAKEIPKNKIRNPPDVPSFTLNLEYPEEDLKWTEKDVFDQLPKKFQVLHRTHESKKKESKFLDKEYEMLKLDKPVLEGIRPPSSLSLLKYSGITTPEDLKELMAVGEDDRIRTPWETDFKKQRVVKKLCEQDEIIQELERGIRQFDDDILELNEDKINVDLRVKNLELAMLTFHQEVLVLKKFEANGEEKTKRVQEKLAEKFDIQKKINGVQSKIDAKTREARRCEEKIRSIVNTFHTNLADNKFYDFLRRIFRKKYRPPRVKTDSDESDSDSDSDTETEEDDAASMDSKDIGPIRLDENVCPEGCDVHLYEMTFAKRKERHTLELTSAEAKKQIDLLKKESETLLKKLRHVDAEYLTYQKDHEDFQREKQVKLNEVETVVVLRLNQFENLTSTHGLEKLRDSVCFSSDTLSRLYTRVGELQKDTEAEKVKHTKNQQHLTRLKIDIKHMEQVKVDLEKVTKQAMIRKFGSVVDTDELQETLLKRLVAEMDFIVLDMEREFDRKLKGFREKLQEKKEAYTIKVQENSERYNILSVLEDEKNKLKEILDKQTRLEAEEKPDNQAQQMADIEKLMQISRMQEDRISTLRMEIGLLRMKVRPVPPPAASQDTDVTNVPETIMIQGCDGETYEISQETKNTLKDMYGEATEVIKDLKDEDGTEEDFDRLRYLIGQILGTMPSKILPGIARRLCEQDIMEAEVETLTPEEIILEILRTIQTESFLETMDVVGEIMQSIGPQDQSIPHPGSQANC